MAYRMLPVSDLPNVDFPTILVNAASARREPGDDGVVGRDAAGEAVLDHRRPRLDDLDEHAGPDQHHAAVRRWTATSTPPRRTCRRRSPRPYRSCRRGCRVRRRTQKVNPADKPVLYLGLSSPTLPLSQVDEYAETYLAERISMISGVAQVEVYGSQKYAVRIQVDPQALASRGIGIDEVAQAIQSANVNLPTGTLYGSHQAVHRTGQRPTDERRSLSAANRRLSQWRAGAAGRSGPRARQRRERQGRGMGRRTSARWYSRSSASRAPTRSRSSTRSSRILPSFRDAVAGLGQNHESRTIARGFDPRLGQRRPVHAAADRVPGRDGDLPVPAQPLRDRHSEPRAADVDHRHLRGDVGARLHASTTSR